MKFKVETMKAIAREDMTEEMAKEYEVVEEGEWFDDGKNQYQIIIFEHKEKFYQLEVSRSGSYFTDYYYCWEDWSADEMIECPEVEKVEKTITVWELVK